MYHRRIILFPGKDYSCEQKTCNGIRNGCEPDKRDLSIIIGASWVAPNQTRGLIEVHFPERGKRERG